tara:strand:- start:3592 stop:4218 length:627 start_codon:yes stop_codon:yes gene_type:complete
MAEKKQAFVTPVGTINHPWLVEPCKWDNEKGRSVKADRDDLHGYYNVTLTFESESFDASDFKKTLDNLWGEHKKQYKGKFDKERPPYKLNDEGEYVIKPRRKSAFMKDKQIQQFQAPQLSDCLGTTDLRDYFVDGRLPGSGSTGRVKVSSYLPAPTKNPQTKENVLKFELDLLALQFSDLVEFKSGGGSMGAIDGVPVMASMDDDLPI